MFPGGSNTTYHKLKENVTYYGLIRQGSKVVVAVSGGADSVGLLHMLHQLAGELDYRIVVAHLNHTLRGKEAVRDEHFVMNCAARMGYECVSKKIDIKALSKQRSYSIEEVAREERYKFLFNVLKEKKAHCIALGHTADDQIETVLMRFLYSGSPHSLRAMDFRRGVYIRPLINVYKKEIKAYLISRGEKWRVDTSNYGVCPERNKVRHHLIPLIEQEYNHGIKDRILWISNIIREENAYMQAECLAACRRAIDDSGENEVKMDVLILNREHPAIVGRIIHTILEKTCSGRSRITRRHVEAVRNLLCRNMSGKEISLPNHNVAAREFNTIVIYPRERVAEIQDIMLENLNHRTKYRLCGLDLYVYILKGAILRPTRYITWMGLKAKKDMYLNLSQLDGPFIIRGRRPGDTFHQFGLRGNKKLKKFLSERKIPARIRNRLPLIVSRRGIACILGIEIADWAKVSEDTKETLWLTLEKG